MQFIKPAAAALAVAMAATAFVPTADARSRHHHHNHGAFGAGIAGFAAGAFFGSLASGPRYGYGYYDDYYEPGYYYQRPRYYEPAPVYVAPRAYYREEPRYYRPGCDSSGAVSRPANSLC